MPGFSEEDYHIIQGVSVLSTFIGTSGALFMILMFVLFTNLRSFSYRLILYLALSDLGGALSFLVLSSDSYFYFCFRLASVLWIDVIAWTMYREVVLHKENTKKKERKLLLLVFGLSLGAAVPALWTKDEMISWPLFYIPLWVSFVYSSFCYYRVYKASLFLINSISGIDRATRFCQLRSAAKLNFYPLTLVIAFFFATVNRIYLLACPPDLILTCMDKGFAHMIGFFNCIVYGLNSKLKDNLKQLCSPSEFEELQEVEAGYATDEEDSSFTCPQCSKEFGNDSDFLLHQSGHFEDKPFSCEICGKRFSVMFNLKTHKRTSH